MDFSGLIHTVTGFISLHPHLALGVIFLLAFGESLAFISLLLPATVILLATGALIGESELTFSRKETKKAGLLRPQKLHLIAQRHGSTTIGMLWRR